MGLKTGYSQRWFITPHFQTNPHITLSYWWYDIPSLIFSYSAHIKWTEYPKDSPKTSIINIEYIPKYRGFLPHFPQNAGHFPTLIKILPHIFHQRSSIPEFSKSFPWFCPGWWRLEVPQQQPQRRHGTGLHGTAEAIRQSRQGQELCGGLGKFHRNHGKNVGNSMGIWNSMEIQRKCKGKRMEIWNGHFTGTDIHWRYRLHIFLAYFSGLCKGIPQQNMALYDTVPPF